MAIKRILVALGGSEYMDVAMRDACEIARRHDGELYGLALGDEAISNQLQATPMGGGVAAKELRESREESIESGMHDAIARFNEVCAAEGIEGHVIEAHGEAIGVIVEQLKLMDLGIFGIRRTFDYGAGTHPDDFLAQVAKAARRPILAVATPAKPIKRVLVAYDGSLPAADALRSFAVLHAFDPEIIRVVTCKDRCDRCRCPGQRCHQLPGKSWVHRRRRHHGWNTRNGDSPNMRHPSRPTWWSWAWWVEVDS